MEQIKPLSQAEIKGAVEQIIAAEPTLACEPRTINGIHYDRVFALSNLSLRDVMALKVQEHADKELLVFRDTRLTTAQTWAAACKFANVLIDEYGIKPTDRVAIAMRNYPEWCIAYMGIIIAGGTVVPLNAWWKEEELTFGLEDCGAKIVVCDAKRTSFLQRAKSKLGLTLIVARESSDEADAVFEDLLEGASADVPAVQIDADSDFCIMYTSGSTGRPKGVCLTHRGVISTLLSWSMLLATFQALRPEADVTPENPACLLALPLFHVTASHSIFLMSLLGGRKMVIMYQWKVEDALQLIREEQVTNLALVPTQAREVVLNAKPGDIDTLRDIGTGGAKRPAHHVEEMAEKLPEVTASSGYGLTETNAIGCIISLQDYQDRPESTGRPVPPVTDIRIFDEDMNEQPIGEVGEVCIKSPANFRGYLNLPEETARAITPDGWFRTGDLGKFDEEGFLYIVDRLKDLIIRGGENISCLEVENEIYKFDGVREVTVFSVPDEKMGEIVGAVIYPGENKIDLEALHAFLLGEMAGFKVPEMIWVSPQQLPRGNTDKVDKRTAREVALNFPPHLDKRKK